MAALRNSRRQYWRFLDDDEECDREQWPFCIYLAYNNAMGEIENVIIDRDYPRVDRLSVLIGFEAECAVKV